MRLVFSAAVLAIWVADTPSSVVDAFSFKGQPRVSARPRFSGLAAPSSLHMSTIERPMTAPGSPNSAGHPFGSYGKPRRDENGDDSVYSYGPKTPPGTVDKSIRNSSAPADSFEAYMQGRNRGGAPPSNPSSPTDNYYARQQSTPASNFGAPSTPPANNNFGAPSTPSTPVGNSSSYSNYATSTPPPANNNFGAPSSPQTPPAAPTAGNSNNNNNSFANYATSVNSSTPPSTPTNNNFGAPQTPAAPSSPSAGGSNNSFASFVTGGNTSTPPPPTAPAPGSFEAYMNSRQSQSPPSGGSSPPFPASTPNNMASTVAAAADPNSPLPPYMSPASLEDPNIKSANLPGSPAMNDGRPNFQAPMPGMSTQQQASTASAQTTFREQNASMQLAQPITAPLARVEIGDPSQELVGRLDQVLNKQREFEVRLDKVDEKIDRTTQENILRTQSMLNEFREDNKKTQETFMNRINSEVHGMKSTMDKVLQEQRDLQQKTANQNATFANLEKARAEQAEKMLTLEKTTSIRAQNIERNANQEAQHQKQRLEALERNAGAGRGPQMGGGDFQLEQQQNERMAAFEQAQLERMAAFEDSQRQELEDALRLHRESSQQHQNNNMNGSPSYMNNTGHQQEQARLDDTERQLQERLEQAQSRKEELLAQLREMQEQEDMNMNNGNGRAGYEDPHSTRGAPSSPPPPPPYANALDERQRFQSPGSRFEDEEEEEEEEQPRRRMMRDRLGKASGEELYKPSGTGRRGADRMENFDEEDDFDDRIDDRMRGMDPEEERRMQHERMMRRDPVSPPEAMGPRPQRRGSSPGSPAGRYDPRRGGPSDDMMEDELAYGIGRDSGMRETLGNMRSFKGDEQLPNKSLFDNSGGMGAMGGSMGGMGRRGSQQQGRRAPAGQDMRQQQRSPQQRSGGAKEYRAGLSQGPPPNPLVDKKIEHFLKETLKSGPKPHFDKELESLLMEKYSPLFSWLKPGNAAFLRNVLVTYLQHKGCQVEMDLKNASPKAAREWDELLNILNFELKQRTGEDPRIMEEPNNQWGIYGSKNMRMIISPENSGQQDRNRSRGGGVSREEAARRKRRNDKAFIVSTDPTDPTTRLL